MDEKDFDRYFKVMIGMSIAVTFCVIGAVGFVLWLLFKWLLG